MDVDDPIYENFMRFHNRPWNPLNLSAGGDFLDTESNSPKSPETTDLANKHCLQLNVQTGSVSKDVGVSLPGGIAYRQLGITKKHNFATQILRLKLRQLKLVSSCRIDFSDYVSCYYVKGFKHDLLGVWNYHEFSATLLKSLTFQYSKLDSKNNNQLKTSISDIYVTDVVTLPSHRIFDVCGFSHANHDYVLFVANSYSHHKNFVHLVPIGMDQWSDFRNSLVRKLEHQEMLWSCSWNSFTKRYAIGADRCFYLHDFDSFSKKIDLLKGQPYSLDFNENGNLLYCGLHSGDLQCFDLRTDNKVPSFTVPLCKNVTYIKLLSDEQTIISSGFNSELLNIDLRLKKSVFQYPNHFSLYKRLTFSLNEALDILCAPGEDNVTRLWSLKEGKPLHTLPLQNVDHCGQIHSFLEADGRRMFVHILLGDSIHSFETLEDTVEDRQVLHLSAQSLY